MYVSIEDIIIVKYHKSSNHPTNILQDFHSNKGKRNRNQKVGCHFSGVEWRSLNNLVHHLVVKVSGFRR